MLKNHNTKDIYEKKAENESARERKYYQKKPD